MIRICKFLNSTAKKNVLDYWSTKLAAQVTSTQKYSTKSEACFEIKPYQLHGLQEGPASSMNVSSKDALSLYEKLMILRRMETAASNLYKEKLIRGFCHLYLGQEAVAVGIRSMMRDTDTVITSYRCHAWVYLMGASVLSVLSELTARKTGVSRSKGGSMHMYSKNFYGGNGIVGSQVPLGTGLGFAHKYKGDGGVSFVVYGDGAANQGQTFESFNIAKLWKLPCIFVCENNLYGMGTSASRSSASTEYYKRGDYVPGILVDGMDVVAVREATRYAIEYCTSGKGPLIVEMDTYRYVGHSMSDPGTSYRTRDEVKEVRQSRDPINNFKEKILNAKIVTAEELKKVDSEVRKTVDEATKMASNDPEIGADEMAADVYKLCLEHNNQIRGVVPNAPLKHLSVTG